MRRTILAISTATVLSLCFWQGEAPAQSRDPGMAPEIAVSDWINGDDRVSLADHRGDVVLLEFWSSH